MLQLLETGKALYVLAVFCGLGIVTRLITAHLYKRLLKESTNLAVTRNKSLKELRQRAENTYRMNQGMRDCGAWLEHQFSQLRFMGMTLNSWNAFSMRWTWLCLLTGAAASFASYWYHLDNLYIVMYGGGAILMAMFSMIFDLGSSHGKREQLLAALQDYLENVMCPRLARNLPLDTENDGNELRAGMTAGRPMRGRRENGAKSNGDFSASAERLRSEAGNGEIKNREWGGKKLSERAARRAAAAAAAALAETPSGETELEEQTDEAYRKQSLEQTAAGKEKVRSLDENWLKDLKPEEVKLLSDILKEYLV
ncbi:MAG: hypothetical protein ACI39W_02040 [Brotaphodocola sp.]